MMTGTIKRLLPTKGFGFVQGPDGLMRFFHAKECLPDSWTFEQLREGMTVEFEPEDGPKGPRANGCRRKDA